MYIVGAPSVDSVFFGIVRLTNPVFPDGPVTLKVTVDGAWFVVMVTFDIWALVMLPVIDSVTCVPWSVVALMLLVGLGVCVGCGVMFTLG